MSNTKKSTRNTNLLTFTSTSSKIPLRYFIDLSINYRDTMIGCGSPSPNFWKIDKGIKLMLVLKSYKTLENELNLLCKEFKNSLDP